MFKLTILLFIIFALLNRAAADCSASISISSSGSGYLRTYNLKVTNFGSCTITQSVNLKVTLPPGTQVVSYNNIGSNGKISVTALAPNQYVTAGFQLYGNGFPSVYIAGFGGCGCGNTNPPNPTTGSSSSSGTPSTPTTKPTPAPSNPTVNPSSQYYTLGLKFAIFTCTADDIRLPVAKLALDGVGSQYDVFVQSTWGTGPLELTNADGSGKYYALISATDLAVCWNSTYQAQIAAYEIANRVKMVILYSFPYASNGVTNVVSVDVPGAIATFAPAFAPYTKALVSGLQMTLDDVWAYLSTISNSSMATPALLIKYNNQQYVGGAFINFPDGRRRLEFYLDQADWAVFPVILGSAWLQWVSNGVFAGSRRVELNLHVDDIFMATGMFDAAIGGESETDLYRITPDDLQATVDWQKNFNSRLPAGSNFTLTFPYNGATVVQEKGGYAKDPLFLKAKAVKNSFIWESHTFTHPYLDNLTYNEVYQEYSQNVPAMQNLYNIQDISKIPNYCSKSTITPSISGLFNGNALRALWDFGIRYVVGDNSRPELIPANKYHVLRSTLAANKFAGMNIIPRHATNIYYDASLPKNIEDLYNYLYEVKLGKHFSFPEVVAADVKVAVKALLSLRHDPFMFHQANLRFATTEFGTSTKTSLLSYWTEAVVAELRKYMNLPIRSHKHDDLGQMYLDREARDNCGFSGTLKINKINNSVVGINAKSTGTCVYGISGVQASGSNVQKYETYGTSETTTWLKMATNSNFDVTFTTPIKAN